MSLATVIVRADINKERWHFYRAVRRAAKRSPISNPYMENKRKPCVDFLMVIMASGIARGRVRTTATTTVESRNMAAILEITG